VIGGVTHIDRDRDVRIDGVGGSRRAAHADFLLRRAHGNHLGRQLFPFARKPDQSFTDDVGTDLVVERTRRTEQLTLGVSPRGLLMLQRAAQARAFLEGREYCTPDDFKQLITPVFAHRVVVNTRFATTQKKSAQVEAILREIIDATRVPL
jgi:MoxR-like ATPase